MKSTDSPPVQATPAAKGKSLKVGQLSLSCDHFFFLAEARKILDEICYTMIVFVIACVLHLGRKKSKNEDKNVAREYQYGQSEVCQNVFFTAVLLLAVDRDCCRCALAVSSGSKPLNSSEVVLSSGPQIW